MGAGAVFLGHAVLVLLVMITTTLGIAAGTRSPILVIGGTQLLYVVPLLVISWRRGFRSFFWGALGAAAITLLLNGGCWGLLNQVFQGP
jgi:hypothetical protein